MHWPQSNGPSVPNGNYYQFQIGYTEHKLSDWTKASDETR
jgi:hypothetical protein